MQLPSVHTSCSLCGSAHPKDYEVLYPPYLPKGSLSTKVFSARRLPDTIHYQLVKCKNDGLVRSTPVFPNSIISNFYRKSSFNYQEEVENLTANYLSSLEPVLSKIGRSATILEIGCGSGFLLTALKKRGFKNVYGVEPSRDAVKKSDPSIKKNITTDLFSKKAVGNKTFDLICMFQTLDHLPELNIFLTECYQSLNPHGYIFSYHHNIEYFMRKIFGEKHPIIDIEHLNLFSPKTTAALFEKNGFLTRELISPLTHISTSHLVWLLPLPTNFKRFIIFSLKRLSFLNFTFRLELGNVAITAQKPGL